MLRCFCPTQQQLGDRRHDRSRLPYAAIGISCSPHTNRQHASTRHVSRTEHTFFLDAVCREPYTPACSHALPRRQRAPCGPFRNLTGDADPDSAHGFVQYSRERAALCGVNNPLRAKREEGACGICVGLTPAGLWSSGSLLVGVYREEARASRVLDVSPIRLVPSCVSVRVMSRHAAISCRMQW